MTTIRVLANEQKKIVIDQPGEYAIELSGSGARAEVEGRFLTSNSDEVEVSLHVIHQAPHTSAQTTLKGVAKDHSKLRFFGQIKIEKNCPDTQSFLEERILLLSDTAKAETVPELEILSDDVKCSHAASISHIPEEHVFYLQSRGISKADAENLIVDGFLHDKDAD